MKRAPVSRWPRWSNETRQSNASWKRGKCSEIRGKQSFQQSPDPTFKLSLNAARKKERENHSTLTARVNLDKFRGSRRGYLAGSKFIITEKWNGVRVGDDGPTITDLSYKLGSRERAGGSSVSLAYYESPSNVNHGELMRAICWPRPTFTGLYLLV